MKKILFLVIITTTISISAKAQNGSILLYGNVGYTSQTYITQNNSKSQGYIFNPGIGYQFSDHFTAGANFNYTGAKTTLTNNTTSESHTIFAGPFLRYSKTLSSLFTLYGQFEADYEHSGGNNNSPVSNGFFTRVFPAIFLNIKNGFGLNFSFGGLSYSTSSIKGVSGSTNIFDFNFGQSVNIGISKNFGGKYHL